MCNVVGEQACMHYLDASEADARKAAEPDRVSERRVPEARSTELADDEHPPKFEEREL